MQVHVWRLRKALADERGEGPLVTRSGGYVLVVGHGGLDLEVFERRLGEGRAALADGRPQAASVALDEALALWHGPALAEFADEPFAREAIGRLEELRLEAIEARIDADLQLGRHRAVIAELEPLVAANPLRERPRAQLMLALYRAGRQADALAVYRDTRKLLDEQLGLAPGSELAAIERAVLAHDPSLDLAADPLPSAPDLTDLRHRRRRHAGLLIAAGAAVLLAALVATALSLTGGTPGSVRVAPNSLAVIDTHNDRVVAAVTVGVRPGAIAYGAGSLWIANLDDQTVSRINPTTLRPLGLLTVGGPPTGLAASANAVWVAESDPTANAVSVRRIDPEFDEIDHTVRIGNVVPGGPAELAAQGDAVWVAPSSGLLARLDPATARIVHQVNPNAGPAGIAIGDQAVWVTDGEANNVTRIDPTTELLTSIAVGNGPGGIAVGEGGVWVADSVDNSIVRIDPNTPSVTATIPVGRAPAGVTVGAGSVWVTNSGDGTVTRIDPATDKVLARIAVGGSPQSVMVANGRAWVTVDARPIFPTGRAPGGATLRMDSPIDVDSMDPARGYMPLSWQLLYATCAKLLNYPDRASPAGARLTPEVARSLPARSADAKTYTFTIRRGFRFSPPNDHPVTAQTFKDTMERSLNPRMKSRLAYEFGDIVGARAYMAGTAAHISGIVARADTLTIHLRAPAPDFLSLLAQPIFCAVPSTTPITPRGERLIPSAGPYYVTSYTPGQGVVLTRNPNYRGSRPHHLPRIDMAANIPSQRAVANIDAGTADYATLFAYGTPTAQLKRLLSRLTAAASGTQRFFAPPTAALDFIELNTHRALFADPRLRRAVNYAINRRALAQLGDGSVPLPERPTDQYLPPGIPGYSNTPIYPLTPDLASARALALGRARTAVLYTCNDQTCDQQAQIIKNDLAPIHIHVNVKTFTWVALGDSVGRPGAPFDLATVGWSADYPDPSAMLTPLLASGSPFLPSLDDPADQRRLAATARLTGPQRYLAYGKLAVELARNAAPFVAYGNPLNHDFFSARIGCQTYGVYGLDLAALCFTHTTH